MSEPRDHHHVPIFYLKQWCGTDGKLARYSRKGGRIVVDRCSPKSTGFQRDLYTLAKASEKDRQTVEKVLAKEVDTPASAVLKLLLGNGPKSLTRAHRVTWTIFLMSLRARTPDVVKMMREQGKRVAVEELNKNPEEYLRVRGAATESTLVEWVQAHTPTTIEDLGARLLLKVITAPKVGNRIVNMGWRVFDLRDSDIDLVASDRPLYTHGRYDDEKYLIALPISPTKLFVASDHHPTQANLQSKSPKSIIKLANQGTAAQARSYVYGTATQHLPLVERRLRRA